MRKVLVIDDTADALSERGVAVVTKGSNPEKLMLAIRFAMMKGGKS